MANYNELVREWIWTTLTDPGTAFAVLMLGASGVAWECAAPRWVAPGVAGLVLAVLATVALPKLFVAWLLLGTGILIGATALVVPMRRWR